MKTFPVVIFSLGVLLFSLGFNGGAGVAADVVPDARDSQLIADNHIHMARSVSETKVYRNTGETYYIDLNDTFPPLEPATERVVTWTEYDRKGRKVRAIDSSTASDNYHALQRTTYDYTYDENKLIRIAIRQGYESDSGKVTWINSFDEITWTPMYMLHRTVKDERSRSEVRTDSTVFNPDGSKRMTYTYTSGNDSFVEEFTYDKKARLKYRRLTMKQGWSPPWEMESTTYTYHQDGSRIKLDSTWRITPDLKATRKRAGDPNAFDYKWKLISAVTGVLTQPTLEHTHERRYDPRGNLIYDKKIVDEYQWVYNSDGKLILHTEYRGPGCSDSIWSDYKDGMLYHEKVRRVCNGYHTDYDDTFLVNGVHLDPERITRVPYTGDITNGATEVSVYHHGWIDNKKVFDVRGLLLQMSEWSFYRDETVTTYEYFTW